MSSFYTPPNVRGLDTQIQYNENGVLSASSDLTWDDTAKELGVGGDINLDDGGTYATTLQLITPTANRTISFPDATGTVALVGGSSGQIIYNNAGAYAGVSAMTFDGTSVTLAGRLINSYTSVASSPAKVFTGTWFTGGTATTTKPHFLIEPTGTTSTAWSTNGTGLGVNAASGFAGRLLDLQLNGTSNFNVDSTGRVSFPLGTAALPSLYPGTDTNTGIYSPGADQLALSTNGVQRINIEADGDINIDSGGVFYDATNNRLAIGTTSPNRLLQVAGATAITNSGDTGAFLFDPAGSVNTLLSRAGQASTTAVDLAIKLGNTEAARIDSSGRLLVGTSTNSGGALLQVNGDRVRIATAKTPASATDTGTTGEVCWDADYIYVCTATNTWKRTAIATW